MQVKPFRPRYAKEVDSPPDVDEAWNRRWSNGWMQLPDFPGWEGAARRDRSAEEPGRPGRGAAWRHAATASGN